MSTLGFDNYVEPLKLYLQKYREAMKVGRIWYLTAILERKYLVLYLLVSRERGRWKQSSLTWEEKSWQGSSSRFAFHCFTLCYLVSPYSILRIPYSSLLSTCVLPLLTQTLNRPWLPVRETSCSPTAMASSFNCRASWERWSTKLQAFTHSIELVEAKVLYIIKN